jgi:hypothetical protein
MCRRCAIRWTSTAPGQFPIRNGDGSITRATNGGTRVSLRDNLLHREDGPAMVRVNRTLCWYREGKLHRENGPAVARNDGKQIWYREGMRHREDGPAVHGVNLRKVRQVWVLRGRIVTALARETIKQLELPHWSEWTDTHKVYFRLAMSGWA